MKALRNIASTLVITLAPLLSFASPESPMNNLLECRNSQGTVLTVNSYEDWSVITVAKGGGVGKSYEIVESGLDLGAQLAQGAVIAEGKDFSLFNGYEGKTTFIQFRFDKTRMAAELKSESSNILFNSCNLTKLGQLRL